MQFYQTNNNAGNVNNTIILDPEKMEEPVTTEEVDRIMKEIGEGLLEHQRETVEKYKRKQP